MKRLLIANRGEIAIRIAASAADLGIETVAVHSQDDARSLHVRRADHAHALSGSGPRAYLDIAEILEAARRTGCDALHPGYGFLSENADLARACAHAGVTFVGPGADALELCGDKTRARQLARRCDVPVLRGTDEPTTLEQAHAFFAALPSGAAVVLKAAAGGGGRGMRVVLQAKELDAAFERCRSEAAAAFGRADLYIEQLLPCARHVEVQVVADAAGNVVHLGERECSLQRRHQKLIEVAPSPTLSGATRDCITSAACRMAREAGYRSLGTFEFLLDEEEAFYFIEANARLQVEHTVTEEVTGLDLVALQLRIASGATLGDLALVASPPVRGVALQARVNMETVAADGSIRPTGGTLTAFEPPAGPGVRVDTFGYSGYTTSPAFDSLLAKVVVHAADYAAAVAKAQRALAAFRIEGVATNIAFLHSLLDDEDVAASRVHTRLVEDRVSNLLDRAQTPQPQLYFASADACEHREASTAERKDAASAGASATGQGEAWVAGGAETASVARAGRAGARVDRIDPLAVVRHGKQPGQAAAMPTPQAQRARRAEQEAPPGTATVRAPMQGTVVGIDVGEGDGVAPGAPLLVMEAMKMEHVIGAPAGGTVRALAVAVGDTVFEGEPLLYLQEGDVAAAQTFESSSGDLDRIRPDLAEAVERHRFGLDEARPEAVERRRKTGQRTARENVDDLCDPGSFAEFGGLVIAAQRRRRELDDLIRRTPGDGMICGIGSINGDLFAPERSRAVVMSYDYTVLAGTQGLQNHRKKDRMFEIAYEQRLPVVILTEGGGGRPGDTDASGVAGLDCRAFQFFGRLSGLVPLVGINSGRCFAGNAALLGCCDVVIATANSSIGMGGPAMIEGGGLGVFHPDEVGPMSVQSANGVVDIAVADEAEGVAAAKKYLSYFQGPLPSWQSADQRLLRAAIPENRLRIYDVRSVIETLADTGSVLELRRGFGAGMVTALARIEGRPLGIIANNPSHLAGAIDPDGADKAARFMQLCDAHDVPILFLCDTPGIMVGPEIEKKAMVRHAARMFVVGASLSVPFFTIVLRKGYGLGAQAMAGGSFHAPIFTVAWPTGEFGGMGLEGAVKLGFQKELAAIEDPADRRRMFDDMVARMYEIGKAVSMASYFEIDDVIDPAESRRWILRALTAAPSPAPRVGKKRSCVDAW
ncbi:MAG TPA: carboxyl transferase domain-containing protein [Candidatus Limnocylindrales bacterium]|nr:carboxyl transferase domain-containing protein [Candidatus Limnocylindrales bacterium]